MIRFENTEVWGFEGAIRGMRNPMNSWASSDSGWLWADEGEPYINQYMTERRFEEFCGGHGSFTIGPKDMELAQKLVKAGSEHRKFLRMIHCNVDLVAPLYFWKQIETYKVGVTSNSSSTMHKIHEKEFSLDDFSHEHMLDAEFALVEVIKTLNKCRGQYISTKSKRFWWQMIQLLPSSYNQRRTLDINYETLLTIYHQREGHKLDEWSDFREWIMSLPYMKEFIGENS